MERVENDSTDAGRPAINKLIPSGLSRIVPHSSRSSARRRNSLAPTREIVERNKLVGRDVQVIDIRRRIDPHLSPFIPICEFGRAAAGILVVFLVDRRLHLAAQLQQFVLAIGGARGSRRTFARDVFWLRGY